MSTRDLVGYGHTPPDPQWPGGARLALNFVINYEERAEISAAVASLEKTTGKRPHHSPA